MTAPGAAVTGIEADFAAAVGAANVSPQVDRYLTDLTEHPPGTADLVVRPGTADEVVAVMQIAARHLAFLFVDITGASTAEMDARLDLVHGILREEGLDQTFPVDDLVRLVPRYEKLARLPTTLDFLLDFPGGGLSWVGSYGPGERWVEGATAGLRILEAHGYPPFLVARPMAGGHYFVLRFVACFDKADAAEVDRVRVLMGELAECVLDHDYVPYKASADAARRIAARAHPGYLDLFRRLRAAVDPEGRMNPGRWPEEST